MTKVWGMGRRFFRCASTQAGRPETKYSEAGVRRFTNPPHLLCPRSYLRHLSCCLVFLTLSQSLFWSDSHWEFWWYISCGNSGHINRILDPKDQEKKFSTWSFNTNWDLLKHAKEHDSAVVTEGGRLVAVHGEAVRPDLCSRLWRLDWHHGLQSAALVEVSAGGQNLFERRKSKFDL